MTYTFDTEIAKKYGVNGAIVISNFVFWIQKNIANGENFFEGRTWTYNSVNAFTQLFPFWSERQIRKILDDLVEKKALIKGNFNKSTYDRTLWYALYNESEFGLDISTADIGMPEPSEKKESIVQNMPSVIPETEKEKEERLSKNVKCICQNCQMDLPELSIPFDRNVEPIPDNKPDNKPDIYVMSGNQKFNEAEDVLKYLNEKSGKRFTAVKANLKHINARLKEKYSIEDLKCVIDSKVKEWKESDMNQYLRPQTLFSEKFDAYLQNAREDKTEKENCYVRYSGKKL